MFEAYDNCYYGFISYDRLDVFLQQSDQVRNLFQSVQLNVDNPHFLIMQGRITKVLNMKPIETLSMLEETAGTRMYERKKDVALKTLVKKQGKVDIVTIRQFQHTSEPCSRSPHVRHAKHDGKGTRTNLNKDVSRLENEEEDLATKKNNVDEIQKKIEDRASVIKNTEDGADDLKTRIDELAKSLEGHEKEKSSNYFVWDKSLLNQLGDAELVVTKAKADLKQLKTKISRCETELNEKTAKLLSKHDEAVALEI
ncbi:structural maintenance of chromosomes protein 2 [Tanacetum coccineum]